MPSRTYGNWAVIINSVRKERQVIWKYYLIWSIFWFGSGCCIFVHYELNSTETHKTLLLSRLVIGHPYTCAARIDQSWEQTRRRRQSRGILCSDSHITWCCFCSDSTPVWWWVLTLTKTHWMVTVLFPKSTLCKCRGKLSDVRIMFTVVCSVQHRFVLQMTYRVRVRAKWKRRLWI